MIEQFVQAIKEGEGFVAWCAFHDWLTENGRELLAGQLRRTLDHVEQPNVTNLYGKATFQTLLSMTFISVEKIRTNGNDEIRFWLPNGWYFKQYHDQD